MKGDLKVRQRGNVGTESRQERVFKVGKKENSGNKRTGRVLEPMIRKFWGDTWVSRMEESWISRRINQWGEGILEGLKERSCLKVGGISGPGKRGESRRGGNL